MADVQSLVQRIRGFISGDCALSPSELAEAATGYAEFINMAASRLNRCGELLRKGFRSEAVRLFQIEPSLEEIVPLLMFPDRALWLEYAKINQLDLPSELLDVGMVLALVEARGAESPLADLLGQHRLYALARAPLWMRIDVLQALAQADPANPVWQEDLEHYERLRRQNEIALMATAIPEPNANEDSQPARVQFVIQVPQAIEPLQWYTLHILVRAVSSTDDTGPAPFPILEPLGSQAGVKSEKFRGLMYTLQATTLTGRTVSLLPQCSGVEFNPPRYAFNWMENMHRVEFRFRLGGALASPGWLRIFQGVAMLAEIPLDLLDMPVGPD